MNEDWMSDSEYDYVIQRAPLVSIDFIIKNKHGEYLLNYRGTRPAKDTWFFFGGVIKKTQEIDTAFCNIINREFKGVLKVDYKYEFFKNVVTHRYKENRYEDVQDLKNGIHYVVLCYEFTTELSEEELRFIVEEHAKDAKADNKKPHVLQIQWFQKGKLLESKKVHENVKKYINLYQVTL